MSEVFVVCVLLTMTSLILWFRRESDRIDREFAMRMAELNASFKRRSEALRRYSEIHDQWLMGKASHEQTEAAYDEYLRVCYDEDEKALS